jgi:hypothetical protein
MELVMFSQLYAGMRGLSHVYHAVDEMPPILSGPPGSPPPFADGWAADPAAFKCGLDSSTRQMTGEDHKRRCPSKWPVPNGSASHDHWLAGRAAGGGIARQGLDAAYEAIDDLLEEWQRHH